MSKLLAAIVASVFALSAASSFAYKLEPMSKEERAELRERAQRMATEQRSDRKEDKSYTSGSSDKSAKNRRSDDTRR